MAHLFAFRLLTLGSFQMLNLHGVSLTAKLFRENVRHQPPVTLLRAGFRAQKRKIFREFNWFQNLGNAAFLHQLKERRFVEGPVFGLAIRLPNLDARRKPRLVRVCYSANFIK